MPRRWPPRGSAPCPRRCWRRRCGPSWPPTPACLLRWQSTRRRKPRSSPPTGSCATCPRRARRRLPARATGQRRSCGSTAPCAHGWRRRGRTRRTSPTRPSLPAPTPPVTSSARSSSTCPSASRCTAPGCFAALAEHVPTTGRRGPHRPGRCGRRGPRVAGPPRGARRRGRATRRAVRHAPAHHDPHRVRWRRGGAGRGPRRARRRARGHADSIASRCCTPSPEPYARLAHEHLHAAGVRHERCHGRAAGGTARRAHDARAAAAAPWPLPPAGRVRLAQLGARSCTRAVGRPPPPGSGCPARRRSSPGRADWDHHLEQLALRYEERGASRGEGRRAAGVGSRAQPRVRPAGAGAALVRARRHRRPGPRGRRAAAVERPRVLGPAPAAPPPRRRDPPRRLAARAEIKAAERVERSLDRLGALDAVEDAVPLDVFGRTLQLELEQDLGRVGRFGDGVLVGSVEMGIGLDLDLVIVLGPGRRPVPRDGPRRLAPPGPRARRSLPERSGCEAERVGRQHRHLLAALASAGTHLLCVPRGDLRRSVERVPSRWVLDVASELCRRRTALVGRRTCASATEPWITAVPSFDAGLRALTTPRHGPGAPAANAPRGRRRPARHRRPRHRARRRGDRRPPQRRVHPVRRQPRRLVHPLAARPRHLSHPPRALGGLPAPAPRGGPPAGRAGGEPRGRA